jgi:hypothetical protein
VFFVQPFDAFDELFKFHIFLQGCLGALYRYAPGIVSATQMLEHEGQVCQ